MGQTIEISINGNVIAKKVSLCDDWESKKRGLLGRDTLSHDEGALLTMPGFRSLSLGFLTSIHMVGMNFGISVAWLDKNGKVVKSEHAHPGDLYHATFRPANYVLELHMDHLNLLEQGAIVTWRKVND